MSQDFYQQAIQEPCVVLGLRLLPLRLGHVLLLNRIGSAFLEHKADADLFGELAIAVAICAQPYAEGLRDIEDPRTPAAMSAWAMRLTRTRFIDRILRRKPVPIDIQTETEKFQAYLQINTKMPHYSYTPSDMQEIACPPVQIVRAFIQRAFGMSDDEILDRPWAQCLWDYITLKALDNQLQMVDRDEIAEAMATAERIGEAIRKRKEGVNGAP